MPDKQQREALKEFLDTVLQPETADWILEGNFVLFKEQLYRLPPQAPSLRGLRVLRAGLHIGEFKKNRFEPSHALALALGKEDVTGWFSLSAEDPRIRAFLRGESLTVGDEAGLKKGWCLVAVDGYSLGWGKYAAGQLKNHYPKGLRKDF